MACLKKQQFSGNAKPVFALPREKEEWSLAV
jgi:hypothetical protein